MLGWNIICLFVVSTFQNESYFVHADTASGTISHNLSEILSAYVKQTSHLDEEVKLNNAHKFLESIRFPGFQRSIEDISTVSIKKDDPKDNLYQGKVVRAKLPNY